MNGPGKFEITWVRRGGPPRNPPNPAYPHGIDVDLSEGAARTCSTPLPYPTGRAEIGGWLVHCATCDLATFVTAASRPDDPRSLKVKCLSKPEDLQ